MAKYRAGSSMSVWEGSGTVGVTWGRLKCTKADEYPASFVQRNQEQNTGKGKGKVSPYSLPSVGPGADPGVQAVSPQVT